MVGDRGTKMAFNIILSLETSNSVREAILNGKTTAVQKLKEPLDGEFSLTVCSLLDQMTL